VLDLAPFVWREKLPVQRLIVSVNGRELGHFDIRSITTVECLVPSELFAGQEHMMVAFRHPDAARPSRVNGVSDDREIALAFEQLIIYSQPDGPDVGTLPLDRLMLEFESLGENCEFGLVQRHYGAEPLDLLRFASAPLPVLLSALRARFDGIGDWDQIDVRVSSNQQEYLVFDKRFGLLYHPWVLVGAAAVEDIRRREARQLPRLRRKLIEDLEEARKIFVYHGMRRLPEPLIRRLAMAMRAYGPTTLLWVELYDPDHPSGTVENLGGGVLKGYIDRFAPGDNAHDLSLEGWTLLCRNAYRIVREGQA
jgi:hypothetical protein